MGPRASILTHTMVTTDTMDPLFYTFRVGLQCDYSTAVSAFQGFGFRGFQCTLNIELVGLKVIIELVGLKVTIEMVRLKVTHCLTENEWQQCLPWRQT